MNPVSGPDRRTSLTAWAFLAPALTLLSVSVLIPAAMALLISFTQTGLDVSEPLRFIGLANLRRLSGDPMFYRVLSTTLIYLVGVVSVPEWFIFGASMKSPTWVCLRGHRRGHRNHVSWATGNEGGGPLGDPSVFTNAVP